MKLTEREREKKKFIYKFCKMRKWNYIAIITEWLNWTLTVSCVYFIASLVFTTLLWFSYCHCCYIADVNNIFIFFLLFCLFSKNKMRLPISWIYLRWLTVLSKHIIYIKSISLMKWMWWSINIFNEFKVIVWHFINFE